MVTYTLLCRSVASSSVGGQRFFQGPEVRFLHQKPTQRTSYSTSWSSNSRGCTLTHVVAPLPSCVDSCRVLLWSCQTLRLFLAPYEHCKSMVPYCCICCPLYPVKAVFWFSSLSDIGYPSVSRYVGYIRR